ncbi:MAG: hypothetical protein HYY16_11990 [Planctomycetes bacterium]|nr:hypothetical protein [Planctomycetota bacterium]
MRAVGSFLRPWALTIVVAAAGCASHLKLPLDGHYSSPHYALQTDLDEAIAQRILSVAEEAHARFQSVLGGEGLRDALLIAFAESREFSRFLARHPTASLGPQAAGFCCHQEFEVAFFWMRQYEEYPGLLRYIVSHEAAHQYLLRQWGTVPAELWIGEGLPDHLATGHEEAIDLGAVRFLVRAGYPFRLRALVERPIVLPCRVNPLEWVAAQFQGHLLLDFLAQHERLGGPFASWLRDFARRKEGASSLFRCLRVDPDVLEEEWRRFLEQRYLDLLHSALRGNWPEMREVVRKDAERFSGESLRGLSGEEAADRFQRWRAARETPLGVVHRVEWDDFERGVRLARE